ncbi:hypothetical protein [Flavobacterium granuli]|uniref:Lipoprotein n=1 Tax=Flavobacterium granuli TaxID=280093 RepID=A0A1M5MS94_9FLAO|nr:hypothetical protein [Flavobacterium granuli]PRZ25063.1 hypothetical protein BC624_103139 [Flavobacterium granuli]SHG80234.1 hypothetical protein SAMN05443373_104138 [Flavobacterium granuli]
MSKKFYILLLVMFGFFMMPSLAFACGTKTEKACCKKESSSQTETPDCCKKNKKSNESSHSGCDGACKNISCSPVVHLGLPSVFYEELNQTFLFSKENQNYYYSEIFISSDFRSVWLPPKIS